MAKVITKKMLERGRKKLAEMLWVMGFHDDDPSIKTARIMRQRIRQIQQRNKLLAINQTSSTVRKITLKFGGQKSVLRQDPTIQDNHLQVLDQSHVGKENNSVRNREIELIDFIKRLGGSEVELVIEKSLTKSDCVKNQGRLLIPTLKLKNSGFLTTDEKRKLEMKESISVEVIDPKRCNFTLNLGQWNMKHENYVLKTNWNKLVLKNELKENMVIRVLSFRVDQKLCFAIVRV